MSTPSASGPGPRPGTPHPAAAPARDGGTPLADRAESWPVSRRIARFEGNVIGVRSDTVAMAGGGTAVRDVVVHPGAVGVVPVDDAGRVFVLNQYRHPVGWRLWEVPAGILDAPSESPLDAARRELFEEAHLVADDWHVLADIFTSPGGSEEALRIFLARGARPADGRAYERVDEEASLVPAWAPLPELVEGVLAGRLSNPTLVVGVLALNAALAPGAVDRLRPADAPWPRHPAHRAAEAPPAVTPT